MTIALLALTQISIQQPLIGSWILKEIWLTNFLGVNRISALLIQHRTTDKMLNTHIRNNENIWLLYFLTHYNKKYKNGWKDWVHDLMTSTFWSTYFLDFHWMWQWRKLTQPHPLIDWQAGRRPLLIYSYLYIGNLQTWVEQFSRILSRGSNK